MTQRLKPGELAPSFAVTSHAGVPLDLADLARRRRVWLAFFRFVTCPMCNLRLHELALAWPRLKTDDIEMIAVFQSPPESVQKWLVDARPPIHVVADPDMTLFARYAVQTSMLALVKPALVGRAWAARRAGIPSSGPVEGPKDRVPADFLIERGGVVKDAFYGRHIADHIPLKRVKRFLDGNEQIGFDRAPVAAT